MFTCSWVLGLLGALYRRLLFSCFFCLTTLQAVLRVHLHRDQTPADDLWFHLSYGNLVSKIFTVVPLVLDHAGDDGSDGKADLLVAQDMQPVSLWQALRELDLTKDWDVDMWELSSAKRQAPEFIPAHVSIVQVEPVLTRKVWRVGPRRAPLPIAGLPRDAAQLPADRAEVEAADSGIDGFPDFHAEGDEVDGPLALAWQAMEDAESAWPLDGGWELSDSDAEAVAEDGRLGQAEFGVALPDPSPAQLPPPPAHDAQVLALAAPVPAEGRQLALLDHQRRTHARVEIPGLGKFVLDDVGLSIACLCPVHGLTCRISKLARKHPLGYFIAWLEAADRYTGEEGRDLHMAARLDRGPGGLLSYENRVAARARAASVLGMAPVFGWEGAGGTEPVGMGMK